MTHDAIDARWTIQLHQLADSMDADRYPGADIVRSAARHIEELTAMLHTKLELDMTDVVVASEQLLASERNAYKERAERAEAGWAEVERLLHANEVAFDEDTTKAVAEIRHAKTVAHECAATLRAIANDLRNAGDVQVVELSEDGVGPAATTLADELWLIALRLDGEV